MSSNGHTNPWTPTEDAAIRAHGQHDLADLASRIDRTALAICHRRRHLGLTAPGRPWTLRERAVLRLNYRSMPTNDLSALLDRTAGQIHSQAVRMGMSVPRRTICPATVRKLISDGLSLADIARRLDFTYLAIRNAARRFGLRPRIARAAASIRGLHCAAHRLGYQSNGHRIACASRVRALSDHPGCYQQGEVAICRALATGPASCPALASTTSLCLSYVETTVRRLFLRSMIEVDHTTPRRGLPLRVWRLVQRKPTVPEHYQPRNSSHRPSERA